MTTNLKMARQEAIDNMPAHVRPIAQAVEAGAPIILFYDWIMQKQTAPVLYARIETTGKWRNYRAVTNEDQRKVFDSGQPIENMNCLPIQWSLYDVPAELADAIFRSVVSKLLNDTGFRYKAIASLHMVVLRTESLADHAWSVGHDRQGYYVEYCWRNREGFTTDHQLSDFYPIGYEGNSEIAHQIAQSILNADNIGFIGNHPVSFEVLVD